jgi:hypothetical protein
MITSAMGNIPVISYGGLKQSGSNAKSRPTTVLLDTK